jgi:hypothetical protein
MSSCIRPGCAVLAVTLATALGACVDPGKRFDDFTERVVDAQTARIDGSGGLFEIDGEFLLAIVPVFAPNNTLRFAVTSDITIDGSSGMLTLSFQALAADKCDEGNGGNEVGDPIPTDQPVAVNEGGAFTLIHEDATVAAEANDVTCGPIRADLELTGQIRDENMFCGDVAGHVYEPLPNELEGSSFGAIRIEPGTRGDANLPEPLKACP